MPILMVINFHLNFIFDFANEYSDGKQAVWVSVVNAVETYTSQF